VSVRPPRALSRGRPSHTAHNSPTVTGLEEALAQKKLKGKRLAKKAAQERRLTATPPRPPLNGAVDMTGRTEYPTTRRLPLPHVPAPPPPPPPPPPRPCCSGSSPPPSLSLCDRYDDVVIITDTRFRDNLATFSAEGISDRRVLCEARGPHLHVINLHWSSGCQRW